eukprot:TRINITY_DN9180_c0_g1_i5.p1 TRINITY_DN9180_c0_g1~~TRINITY_DN9180_c0_g1_i5.p1  ORF type:complete len:252 (+),score=65.96 TRINITY_DN9180_c0_g1_i5:3-758(+)
MGERSQTEFCCTFHDHKSLSYIAICLNKECRAKCFLCLRCVREHNAKHSLIQIEEAINDPSVFFMSLPFWNEKLFQDMIKEVQERKKSEVDKIEFLIDQKFDELVFQAEEMINNLRTRVKDSLRDLRAAEDYLVKVISENVTTEELSSLFEKNKPNFSEMVKNILAKLEAAPEIEANAKTAKSIKGHLWALVEDDGMKDIAQKLEKVLNSTQLGKRFNPQHRPFFEHTMAEQNQYYSYGRGTFRQAKGSFN